MNDANGPDAAVWLRGILRAGEPHPTTVVKFGGSLLARADWQQLLRSLAATCRSGKIAIVVGGGATVDSIRRIDAAAGFDAAVSHRLAIDAMGITARLAADSTGWPLAANLPASASPCVVDVPAWLDAAGRFTRLPAGWHVTSDSIAAFIAAETGSDLLLAKTVPPPTDAAAGWVDGWFSNATIDVGRIEWAAPVSPTTSPRPAGRRAPRASASRLPGSPKTSRRSPTAGSARRRRR
jgi:hypothetical protein